MGPILPRSTSLLLAAILLLSDQVLSSAPPPSSWSSGFDGPRASFLETVLEGNVANQKSCKPTGLIQDACCDYQTVEQVNDDISSMLGNIIQLPFFRYQKVDLFRECPFWQEDGSCMNRACAVQETDEDHIPEAWRSGTLGKVKEASQLPSSISSSDSTCNNFCVLDEDDPLSEGVYVDLFENPERFTGYAGHSANKVWKAIYEENCFDVVPFLNPNRDRNSMDSGSSGYVGTSLLSGEKSRNMGVRNLMGTLGLAAPRDPQDEQCLEKRVYYRLISGLHASISIHICAEYLDQSTGEWRPNLECFISRIAEHPERLQNVYFNYVLMLRALTKISPYLKDYQYTTGEKTIDEQTKASVGALLDKAESCSATFDEHSMFSGAEARTLKEDFKSHFRNVSRIMDCVGCDKCRLWGKTQITGVATGLKILFSFDEASSNPTKDFELKRSEIVAFIWTLHRFSESLAAVEEFREMWSKRSLESKSEKEVEPAQKSTTSSIAEQDIKGLPLINANLEETSSERPETPSTPSENASLAPTALAEPLFDELGRKRSPQDPESVKSPPTAVGPRITDIFVRLYDACRSSIAACLTLVERGIAYVAGTLVHRKDEL